MGALYKEKKPKGQAQGQGQNKNAQKPAVAVNPAVAKHAYVEDAPESPEPYNTASKVNTVSKVAVPPRAPSPPPPTTTSVPVNVFDYLVAGSPSSPASSVSSVSAARGGKGHNGVDAGVTPGPRAKDEPMFTYGNAPIASTQHRYDSDLDVSMPDARDAPLLPTQTPAARNVYAAESQAMSQSDKKRKRGAIDEAEPATSNGKTGLHSGLTGGLDRLLKAPNIQEQPSPLSPKKRSKRSKDEEDSTTRQHKHEEKSRHGKEDADAKALVKADAQKDEKRRKSEKRAIEGGKEVKAIEFTGANGTDNQALVKPGSKAVVSYKQKPEQSHSEFFLSLVDKGAESVRGQSIYGLLKTFHEGLIGGVGALDAEDKKLFRGLRMKKGKHGEVVLFARPDAEMEGM